MKEKNSFENLGISLELIGCDTQNIKNYFTGRQNLKIIKKQTLF